VFFEAVLCVGMDAFSRSYACQVLDEVGLKRADPTPLEHITSLAGMGKDEAIALVGEDILVKIAKRKLQSTSILGRTMSASGHNRRHKVFNTITAPFSSTNGKVSKSPAEGSALVQQATLLDVTDLDEVVSSSDYSLRKKRLRDARDVLVDRAIHEMETRHSTYTVDAKYDILLSTV
jgi:hypothetical protein